MAAATRRALAMGRADGKPGRKERARDPGFADMEPRGDRRVSIGTCVLVHSDSSDFDDPELPFDGFRRERARERIDECEQLRG